jgi:hypothetical protein
MFRIESIHHLSLTRLKRMYNAVTRQAYDIDDSFLCDPRLQSYPYKIIVIVIHAKLGLNNC